MTAGQEVAWSEHGPHYLIPAPPALARESLDPNWRLVPEIAFGRKAPLVVEIGTGQGENIVAAAARDPGRDYLGVEVYRPGIARTILRARAAAVSQGLEQLTNLRVLQANAPELLDTALPPSSVAELWVFFPDPWPKARHRKRRLISARFAELAARVLEPGGILRLATDWSDYAEHMQQVLDGAAGFVPEPTDRFDGRVPTAFERKGQNAGRPVVDLAYRRTGN